MNLVSETDLVCAIVRHHLDGTQLRVNEREMLHEANWHRVLWFARKEGVLLFLHDTLKCVLSDELYPSAIAAQVTALREVNQLHALARARELCQIQKLFEQNGIRAITADASVAAYSCGIRADLISPVHTLQYLVPFEQIEHARALVLKAGHRLIASPETLTKIGKSAVRLNSHLPKNLAVSRFWDTAVEFSWGGVVHLRPAFSHWLILRAFRLRRLVMSLIDAYEIVILSREIAAPEWPGVLTEAAQFGLEGAFAAVIATAHAAIGLPPPVGFYRTPQVGRNAPGDARPFAGTDIDMSIRAPFLPTPPLVVDRMLQLAETRSDDVVCDLGCGDGRILIRAATEFGARGIGVDYDPNRISEAEAAAAAQGVRDRISFQCGDLFTTGVAEATVITCYLLPHLLPAIEKKLTLEARPGTRIISHEFIFHHWPPEKTEIIRTGPMKISQIYLWKI